MGRAEAEPAWETGGPGFGTRDVTAGPEPQRLSVGYVAAPHGIRGAIRVQLFDRASTSIQPGADLVFVRRPKGDRTSRAGTEVARKRVVSVSEVPGKPAIRVGLEAVDDREGADALVGLGVDVERDALPPLGEDEFYLADAVGLRVERSTDSGQMQQLGRVVGLTSNGAQDLFEVEFVGAGGRAHRWLLPVLPGFVKEVDSHRVWVDPPLGMLPAELDDRGRPS